MTRNCCKRLKWLLYRVIDAESVIDMYGIRRICTFHFRGWRLVYVETVACTSCLITNDLYAPCEMFGCVQIHYEGKWEGVGPWKSRLFWAL
jgi:hypothetical protein